MTVSQAHESPASPQEYPIPGMEPDNLRDVTAVMHREVVQPYIDQSRAGVLKNHEPAYGYLGPYTRTMGNQDAASVRAIIEAADAVARQKPASQRNGYDLFVLGTSANVPADMPAQTDGSTHYGYYEGLGDRMLESLRTWQRPEGFEDTAVLEQGIDLLIARGLSNFGRQSGHRSVQLETAAELLKEATMRIPDFNPVNAGLFRLFSRVGMYAGVLQAESPHWARNRAGRTSPDPVGETVYNSLRSVEETMAALAIQGRSDLLIPEPAQD